MRFAVPPKQKFGQTKNVELLGKVVEGLISVMGEEGVERGVGEAAKKRCLVDVLAGCGELAFVQNWHTQEERKWDEKWNMLVNRSVELFSIMLADHTPPFLHPALFRGNAFVCFPGHRPLMLLGSWDITRANIPLQNTHVCSPPLPPSPPSSPRPS